MKTKILLLAMLLFSIVATAQQTPLNEDSTRVVYNFNDEAEDSLVTAGDLLISSGQIRNVGTVISSILVAVGVLSISSDVNTGYLVASCGITFGFVMNIIANSMQIKAGNKYNEELQKLKLISNRQ